MQCVYCGKDEEPMCATRAVRHTVDKHPFEVALQVADYSSLMSAEFVSRSSWWIAMKLHLEHQIEQICPTVTRLAPHGDLLMMTSSNDRATSSHGQGGSQLPSSGGRQLETNTSSESEGSEEERLCSRIKKSIGLKMSSGSEGSDEERLCSIIKRASYGMCKSADDWAKEMQDHWILAGVKTPWKEVNYDSAWARKNVIK